jgi:Kef-type K+ transport system membrane component KefB
MIGGYLTGLIIGLTSYQSLFLGILLSATSVSISVQVLKELKQLKSKEGLAILGAAVLDDVVGIIALAFMLSFGAESVNIIEVITIKVVFFAIAIATGIKIVPWLLHRFAKLRISEATISIALIICFIFASGAEYAGLGAIIGAYIAGVSIGRTEFGHIVFHKVETIGYAIFVPVFFTRIGVSVKLENIGSFLPLIIGLSAVAVVSKMLGSCIGAKLSGFSMRSSLGIGAAMVSRGEVALIIAQIGIEKGIFEQGIMAVLVIVVLITTLVTPPMLKYFFNDKLSTVNKSVQSA